jgi:hypothetical protein
MRIKTERVAGIVALSYLVLIPVAGVYFYKKLEVIDKDLTIAWEKMGLEESTQKVRKSVIGQLFQR